MSPNALSFAPIASAPFKVLTLASCTSTMDEAAARAKLGDFSYNAIRAETQTAGRGRLGRSWQTFPQHSLAATLLWPGAPIPHLTLLSAVSLRQAICHLHSCGSRLLIKWPNDLLAADNSIPAIAEESEAIFKKVSGVLVETGLSQGVGLNIGQSMSTHARAYSLLGVGVNLTTSPEQSDDFLGISLHAALGEPVLTADNLLNAFMACLFGNLALYQHQGWTPFHKEYVRHCVTIGRRIVWQRSPGWQESPANPTHELTGLVRGLNPNGHLEMVGDDGQVHIIPSGEVHLQSRSHR